MFRGQKTLHRAASRVRSRFVDGALILLYHRVTSEKADPYFLNVTPERFTEHLQIIRQRKKATRLTDLARQVEQGRVTPGGIVVTFDDGYADNVHTAKPLLERFDTPATVFVTSGFLGRQECWWDRLSRLLLGGPLPGTSVTLSVAGKPQTVRSESAEGLLRAVHRLIRPADEDTRESVLDELAKWVGDPSRQVAGYRFMTADELVELSRSEMIEVGAHTETHPVLASLSETAERREIVESRAALERVIGRPVTSVSFPYGQRTDYTSRTLHTVRNAGFEQGCTAIPDVVWRRTPQLELPRLWVYNWTGDEFSRHLSSWLGT